MGKSLKRKICVVTGTRADYGILYPVMKAIQASLKLRLYVVATSMHLMKEFGYTVEEIEKDGFKIYDKINISYKKDTGSAMANSVGKAVVLFSKCFKKLKPDIVVILGDRGEMLAAALSASYMNIPIAHIHGGELSGHVDGALRHAITKLSHIHLPASQNSKERIIKLGENPNNVFVGGAPALDRILNENVPDKKYLYKKYEIKPGEPFAILVQHPVSTEIDEAGKQIKYSIEALAELKIKTIIVYPNADAGGRRMIKVIKEHENNPYINTFKSIPHKDYLGLMKIASVLVGNSSSGIIEAPSYKLPAVNIGTRQMGRERSKNVIDASYAKKAIKKAVKKALFNKEFKKQLRKCRNPYGDGLASRRIIKVLHSIKLDKLLLQKQMIY